MPFVAPSVRSLPLDVPHNLRPVEARIIDEALKILGPNGERWI